MVIGKSSIINRQNSKQELFSVFEQLYNLYFESKQPIQNNPYFGNFKDDSLKLFYLYLEATKKTNYEYHEGQDKLISLIREVNKMIKVRNGKSFYNCQQTNLRKELNKCKGLIKISTEKVEYSKGRKGNRLVHTIAFEIPLEEVKRMNFVLKGWYDNKSREDVFLYVSHRLNADELKKVILSLFYSIFKIKKQVLTLIVDEESKVKPKQPNLRTELSNEHFESNFAILYSNFIQEVLNHNPKTSNN